MREEIQVNNDILQILYKRCSLQELTAPEAEQLEEWLALSEWNRKAMEEIMDDQWLTENLTLLNASSTQRIWNQVQQKTAEQTPVIPIARNKQYLWRYAAAALLVISSFSMLLWLKIKPASISDNNKTLAAVDVAPGTNSARLTLSDGSTILLDSVQPGLLASQGNVHVIMSSNGQLRYESDATGGKSTEPTLNTLTTPKGGQYQLGLPDGSRVWLNAASSITYATTFSSSERLVTITGEAYFQVAKDVRRPFRVIAAGTKIEVLGTHFNVSAYDNEPATATTLEEGAVAVVPPGGSHSQRLNPGQQALTNSTESQVKIIQHADMEQALAWVHGNIVFHNADVPTIMRALERWYNINVEIKGSLQDQSFYFSVNRNAPLSEVLHFLEVYKINYSLDAKNRRLTITL